MHEWHHIKLVCGPQTGVQQCTVLTCFSKGWYCLLPNLSMVLYINTLVLWRNACCVLLCSVMAQCNNRNDGLRMMHPYGIVCSVRSMLSSGVIIEAMG